jgi:8-oxo-dGTP pyrophosphatase MutT (NUDIX family)
MSMKREFSAGAVIFRRGDGKDAVKDAGKDASKNIGKIFYLLLHYHFKGDYWDFPRGNIEKGETAQQAAVREIREETGLDAGKGGSGVNGETKFVEGFAEKSTWFYQLKGERIFKQAKYFLAETEKKDIKISEEHLEFKWLEFDDAVKQLTHDNSRRVLKKANEFLQQRTNSGIKNFLKEK